MEVDNSASEKRFNRDSFFTKLNRNFRLPHGRTRLEKSDNFSGVMDDMGLQNAPSSPVNALKPLEIVAPRIDTYRFSMANLEETQDADLDAILGELCALDSEYDEEISRVSAGYCSPLRSKNVSGGSGGEVSGPRVTETSNRVTAARTHSPDNDSAFSDTVSMLSGESLASSGMSAKCKTLKLNLQNNQKDPCFQQKADKIKLALERMREANIKKLFIKAFSTDGSSKSLLIDEKMNCGYVARLLADKNHVTMEPHWAIVEQLPDLHMERVYEDHELLVDNLMLWTRESKNRILFAERPDKTSLFQTPEKYILPEDDRGRWSDHDEHSRLVIIEEFFGAANGASVVPSVAGHPVPAVEGPLYLKSDAKKGWKKYHFVLRPSGLYYFPKEKVKTLKELVCLASFDNNEVYLGVNWKKKYKSPTEFCFAIKHPRLQQPKSVKFIKFLCADDQHSLDRWIIAMRIAKHGRRLLDNHRSLMEELAQEDLDHLAHARSCSVSSIPTKTNRNSTLPASSPASQSVSSNTSVAHSDISSGRHSRASSSSSSGCLSDGGAASESTFDSEFPMGTIKRKPSMKPNIPLTWMTRQLKEMAENEEEEEEAEDGGTLTRRPRRSLPTPSRLDNDTGTLKRQTSQNACDSGTIYGSVNGQCPSNASLIAESTSNCNHYEAVESRDNNRTLDNVSQLFRYTAVYDKGDAVDGIEDMPLPPPPAGAPDVMYSSTLSLESLPPPPPPLDMMLQELSDSQMTLPPPPPAHTLEPPPGRVHDIVAQLSQTELRPQQQRVSFPRQPSLDSVSSGNSRTSEKSVYAQPLMSYGACLVEMQAKKTASPMVQRRETEERKLERGGSIKKVAFADEAQRCPDAGSIKKTKKISFACDGERPASPRKPQPPKRNESTRLSSPKKLVDSESNPPKDFLKDLQRVMRKKWQVAQKCKSDLTTTPHEVLGFREYPLAEDYKETSVSMWVQEHYGDGSNVGVVEDIYYDSSNSRIVKMSTPRRPPPAPPRRSDTTQLTTLHHSATLQPSAS